MQSFYSDLLRKWCDGLVRTQLGNMGEDFDGGFLCPACKYQHGRCVDAVYPLLCLASRTGDEKYVTAAKAVFDWHDRWMMSDDGSARNDPNAEWCAITVFAATALCEALEKYSGLLDGETVVRWRARLTEMAEWLYANLDEFYHTHINYVATNSAAMALCGAYLGKPEYTAQAKHLMDYVLVRFTENGLLWGESHDRDLVTPRGCRPIDIGYDVEESVPSLVKCAHTLGDSAALDYLTGVLKKQLDFMLPDGAWDNTAGTRSNKWTYYGSRTSDGCAGAYVLLADRDPAFAAAARRNLGLMADCTGAEGLLFGGVQYAQHGERPCVHHTFTHANALAFAIDAGIEKYDDTAPIPSDSDTPAAKFFPELAAWKLTVGPWRATVTANDFEIERGHASGGTLTVLWHKSLGPVVAGAVVDYQLVEPTNMQISTRKKSHRTLVPRAELWSDGIRFASCYDRAAEMTCSRTGDSFTVEVQSELVSMDGRKLPEPLTLTASYEFAPASVTVRGRVTGNDPARVRFVLPVIPPSLKPEIAGDFETAGIFFLTGGFEAVEYSLVPDKDGCFAAVLNAPASV